MTTQEFIGQIKKYFDEATAIKCQERLPAGANVTVESGTLALGSVIGNDMTSNEIKPLRFTSKPNTLDVQVDMDLLEYK